MGGLHVSKQDAGNTKVLSLDFRGHGRRATKETLNYNEDAKLVAQKERHKARRDHSKVSRVLCMDQLLIFTPLLSRPLP